LLSIHPPFFLSRLSRLAMTPIFPGSGSNPIRWSQTSMEPRHKKLLHGTPATTTKSVALPRNSDSSTAKINGSREYNKASNPLSLVEQLGSLLEKLCSGSSFAYMRATAQSFRPFTRVLGSTASLSMIVDAASFVRGNVYLNGVVVLMLNRLKAQFHYSSWTSPSSGRVDYYYVLLKRLVNK
jgi:hypothetical protein